MVAETNFIYLAFLIVIQYLGLNYAAYEVNINLRPESQGTEKSIRVKVQQMTEDTADWVILVNKDGNELKVPMNIQKNIVTDIDRSIEHKFNFDEIDFSRFENRQDTIYTKNNKAIATVENDSLHSAVIFTILDSSMFESIIMKYN